MTTQDARRIGPLCALLLLLCTGCERLAGPEALVRDDQESLRTLEGSVTIRTSRIAETQALEFEIDGAIDDIGHVTSREAAVSETGHWSESRLLQGARGTLRIELRAPASLAGTYPSNGTFVIVDGTGIYGDLRGSGTFRAKTDEHGPLWERFACRVSHGS